MRKPCSRARSISGGMGHSFFRFPRSFPGCGLREKEWRKGAPLPLPLSRSSLPLPLPRWVRGWRKPARGSPTGTASHEEFAVTPRSRSFDFFSAFPAEPPPFRRCNIFFRFRRKGSYCSVDARRSPAGRIDCRPALFSPPHRKRRGGGDAAASTQRSGLRSGCCVACAACSPGYLAPGGSSACRCKAASTKPAAFLVLCCAEPANHSPGSRPGWSKCVPSHGILFSGRYPIPSSKIPDESKATLLCSAKRRFLSLSLGKVAPLFAATERASYIQDRTKPPRARDMSLYDQHAW